MIKENKAINVIILAAGTEQSVQNDGFPICLTELDSMPLIQKIIISCESLINSKLIVCFSKQECEKYHLDNIVKLLKTNQKVVKIPSPTQGALCTAMLCVGEIDNDDELLIINGNELLDIDFSTIISEFRERKIDAGVVVFKSVHPRYSYVKLSEKLNVVEASEKNPISNFATAGFYWFKKGKYFVEAAKSSIRKDARVNNNFYICPTFNEMILKDYVIGIHEISERKYFPLKDIRQLKNFENKFERN